MHTYAQKYPSSSLATFYTHDMCYTTHWAWCWKTDCIIFSCQIRWCGDVRRSTSKGQFSRENMWKIVLTSETWADPLVLYWGNLRVTKDRSKNIMDEQIFTPALMKVSWQITLMFYCYIWGSRLYSNKWYLMSLRFGNHTTSTIISKVCCNKWPSVGTLDNIDLLLYLWRLVVLNQASKASSW